MIRSLFRAPDSDNAALEAALERSVERLLGDSDSTAAAAPDPAHAFLLRLLVDAAAELRAAHTGSVPPAHGRAELIARLHWTPQQRPSALASFQAVRRAPWRELVAAPMTRIPGRLMLSAAAAFAVLLAIALAFAGGGSTAAASTLTILEGTVEVRTGTAWRPLADGAPVSEGDRLRLGPGSAALLTFADGSVLHLAGRADIELMKATFDGARMVTIDQRAGHVGARVPLDPRAGAAFTLSAPGAVVQVTAGAFAAEVTSEGTRVDDLHGRVAVLRDPQEGSSNDRGAKPAAEGPAPGRLDRDSKNFRQDAGAIGASSVESRPGYAPSSTPAPADIEDSGGNAGGHGAPRRSERQPVLLPPLERRLFPSTMTPALPHPESGTAVAASTR